MEKRSWRQQEAERLLYLEAAAWRNLIISPLEEQPEVNHVTKL